MSHRVHFIDMLGAGAQTTACGRTGWEARGIADEYETERGDRFEASINRRRVTCLLCKRSPEFKRARP